MLEAPEGNKIIEEGASSLKPTNREDNRGFGGRPELFAK